MDLVTLDRIRAELKNIKLPSRSDRIFKDECVFSFATPQSDGGLFINLGDFQGYGKKFVLLDHERTGNTLYYNEQHHCIDLEEEEMAAQDAIPSKMAIGGEHGFNVNKKKFKIEKEGAIVLMPEGTVVKLPCAELPEHLLNIVQAIQNRDGVGIQEQTAVWEEEKRESKFARDLPQLKPSRKIPPNPKEWKCDFTGVTDNLWLNLSTGSIGSGREQWDGTGGNGAALKHFSDTGKKYPLCVKLGTITQHGADVYSYDSSEDDLVLDPLLKEHLAHWGINMMEMEKTEKTMAELQIDRNVKAEFTQITEGGATLRPVQGPGAVGLLNLGNFCYMNSVVQALFGIPALAETYVDNIASLRKSSPPVPAEDFLVQFGKLGTAILTGETDKPALKDPDGVDHLVEKIVDHNTVCPSTFKALVGRQHPEFSTGRQQDACDYFVHLLEIMEAAERNASSRLPPSAPQPASSSLFSLELEYRTQCSESGAVSYKRSPAAVLSLNIPLDEATNQEEVSAYRAREAKRAHLKEQSAEAYIGCDGGDEVIIDESEDPVLPKVPFDACARHSARQQIISDVYSPAIGRNSTATQTVRIASFPPYLMIQLARYYVDDQWRARKMEVLAAMPESINLESLRAYGAQPSERLQPEDDPPPALAAPKAVVPDPTIVSSLRSAGFSDNACQRATIAVANNSAEAAMNWLLSHMDDEDINNPIPQAAAPAQAAQLGGANLEDAVQMLRGLGGFTERQAKAALTSCNGDTERAADWLFTRMGDLDAAVASVEAVEEPKEKKMLDGEGKYELVAIVSHIGSNTGCGHYVAHVKKKGEWYIYNDDKVAVSEKLPLELGYMFMYRRKDAPWS